MGESIKEQIQNGLKLLEHAPYTVRYIPVKCLYCGRTRVELWTDGKHICQKCGRDLETGEIDPRSDV